MQVGNVDLSWITLLTAVVGALLGAAIASFVWAHRVRRARQDFSFSMRKRAAQTEKLRDQFADLEERLRSHEAQTAELAEAKRDLAAVRSELEQANTTLESTRLSLDETQRSLETARAEAAESEARLASQRESERNEDADRRHHIESELNATRDTLLTLQDELSSARASAQRTINRLELDLDATRSMLQQSADALRGEREAGSSMRDELRAQLSTVDWDRLRAEAELADVRREMAEKLAATQPYIATMREQYLLAAAERDAMVKELTAQRERAEENARAIEQTRAEFALALDEEHRTAMELLNRAWSYVQTFPRVPESWGHIERRAGAPTDDSPQPPPSPHKPTDSEARLDVEPSADRPRDAQYDIEAELADAIGEDLDTRSFSRTRKPRKPIGTMKLGNETVVVCDDGSTWRKSERGWRQVNPVPGTPAQSREPRIERAG